VLGIDLFSVLSLQPVKTPLKSDLS
jgi:hypothetical protein